MFYSHETTTGWLLSCQRRFLMSLNPYSMSLCTFPDFWRATEDFSFKKTALYHIYIVTGPMKHSKVLISNVPKKVSSCQIDLFKVFTMSTKVRVFQRTNSRAHTTHTDKMVQGKLYQVRFLGVHNIKALFFKLTSCQ